MMWKNYNEVQGKLQKQITFKKNTVFENTV